MIIKLNEFITEFMVSDLNILKYSKFGLKLFMVVIRGTYLLFIPKNFIILCTLCRLVCYKYITLVESLIFNQKS